MQYRRLGKTGVDVSAIAFGAGPVPALMTTQGPSLQRATVQRALSLGINWFDTAATYGNGQSESSLGAVLREVAAPLPIHVATKVRVAEQDRGDIRGAVLRSVEGSLTRLGVPRVTLLQLHNSITAKRGDEPTSLAPDDVLGSRGVLEAMIELRAGGLVSHLGLTGIGQPAALESAIGCGQFATMQVPYHALNPSAGQVMHESFMETNYGNVIAACGRQGMGVFAIRVFAGGALVGQPPSAHTHRTPFFPLDLYRRDQARAARWQRQLAGTCDVAEAALRFSLSHPLISSAIIGFATPEQVEQAVAWSESGPLPEPWRAAET